MNSVAKPPSEAEAALAQDREDLVPVLDAAFPDGDGALIEHLHGVLSVLDAKASSLMAFNAIGLAALAIWLEKIPANLFHFILDFVFLLFLLSSLLCFRVIDLHWSKARTVKNRGVFIREMLVLRDERTTRYNQSRRCSRFAVIVFMLLSALHVPETFLRMTDQCGPRCEAFYSARLFGVYGEPGQAKASDHAPVPPASAPLAPPQR